MELSELMTVLKEMKTIIGQNRKQNEEIEREIITIRRSLDSHTKALESITNILDLYKNK